MSNEKEKRTVQITIKATDSMREKLMSIAEKRDWTLSHTAFRILEFGLESYESDQSDLRKTA